MFKRDCQRRFGKVKVRSAPDFFNSHCKVQDPQQRQTVVEFRRFRPAAWKRRKCKILQNDRFEGGARCRTMHALAFRVFKYNAKEICIAPNGLRESLTLPAVNIILINSVRHIDAALLQNRNAVRVRYRPLFAHSSTQLHLHLSMLHTLSSVSVVPSRRLHGKQLIFQESVFRFSVPSRNLSLHSRFLNVRRKPLRERCTPRKMRSATRTT